MLEEEDKEPCANIKLSENKEITFLSLIIVSIFPDYHNIIINKIISIKF